MNGKTKKVFFVYAILCALQTCFAAKKTCRKGLLFREDRGGSLEEVKQSLIDETCNRENMICMSFTVEEIEIDNEISECDMNVFFCCCYL